MLLPDNQALPENLVEIQFPSERKSHADDKALNM